MYIGSYGDGDYALIALDYDTDLESKIDNDGYVTFEIDGDDCNERIINLRHGLGAIILKNNDISEDELGKGDYVEIDCDSLYDIDINAKSQVVRHEPDFVTTDGNGNITSSKNSDGNATKLKKTNNDKNNGFMFKSVLSKK